ncbi:MAG: HAMP domain-containing histidine kinase [Alistipes sp.]|nr:HAMP domain-containing histidine kinase [Alistipes sp.]
MNRSYFRNISILVVLSLILLATVQGVWVYRIYRDSENDFVRRVESAAYKSIYKAFRMDAIPGITTAKRVNIDLTQFALYFETNLLELDALQPYKAEVMEAQTMRTMMVRHPKQQIVNPMTTQVTIDDDGLFLLRLTIDIPYKVFWNRMWGIILSSVAIILLLGLVLLYLVRTMFRQRTIAQMRRDFTHNITHELKTPISVAIAATDALQNFSAEADSNRRARYLCIIESQLSQLSAMVERILSVSVEGREQSFNPAPFDVVELLSELKEGVMINSQKPIDFAIIAPSSLLITADQFHIRNLITTLVDNAIKYSGDSLTLTIRVAVDSGVVIISATDNGFGIDKSHLNHIFEQFYRVPTGDVQAVRGYGLGLYYAHKVVQMHGGEISAQSTKGRGTTITIKLPYDE